MFPDRPYFNEAECKVFPHLIQDSTVIHFNVKFMLIFIFRKLSVVTINVKVAVQAYIGYQYK